MPTMRVLRLVVHARTREPVLLLGEVDGDRCLPVFLRRAAGRGDRGGPRAPTSDPPLVQDVLVPVVEGLGRKLEGVEITELRDGVFRAELVFDAGTRIPARPSDVLAVAVREGLPIAVAGGDPGRGRPAHLRPVPGRRRRAARAAAARLPGVPAGRLARGLRPVTAGSPW